jgi:hypothetical protein
MTERSTARSAPEVLWQLEVLGSILDNFQELYYGRWHTGQWGRLCTEMKYPEALGAPDDLIRRYYRPPDRLISDSQLFLEKISGTVP